MKQELIKNSTVSKFENIAGQKILVNKGQFWIQTQRQGHSLHYIVPYFFDLCKRLCCGK